MYSMAPHYDISIQSFKLRLKGLSTLSQKSETVAQVRLSHKSETVSQK